MADGPGVNLEIFTTSGTGVSARKPCAACTCICCFCCMSVVSVSMCPCAGSGRHLQPVAHPGSIGCPLGRHLICPGIHTLTLIGIMCTSVS